MYSKEQGYDHQMKDLVCNVALSDPPKICSLESHLRRKKMGPMGMPASTQVHKQLAAEEVLEKQVLEGILDLDNMTGSRIAHLHHTSLQVRVDHKEKRKTKRRIRFSGFALASMRSHQKSPQKNPKSSVPSSSKATKSTACRETPTPTEPRPRETLVARFRRAMAGQGGGERGGGSAEKKEGGGEAPTTAPEMQSSDPQGLAVGGGGKWVLVRPMAPDGLAEGG
ncbi:hypothetical protein BHE74_00018915 [Ensete ventricosum]|nr:hypothetical protein GW17_00047396 [Ensete ventricosum]RWW73223.1 hypothetical protein BHE74_00018915 [Ensete ventricosum]RZR94663.1 hypothetical protein BHM03_00023416 [Ensete ventricosum]